MPDRFVKFANLVPNVPVVVASHDECRGSLANSSGIAAPNCVSEPHNGSRDAAPSMTSNGRRVLPVIIPVQDLEIFGRLAKMLCEYANRRRAGPHSTR
jgi:hypothetical protein